MLNWTLLQNLLIIAAACSSITVIFIQKTKNSVKVVIVLLPMDCLLI